MMNGNGTAVRPARRVAAAAAAPANSFYQTTLDGNPSSGDYNYIISSFHSHHTHDVSKNIAKLLSESNLAQRDKSAGADSGIDSNGFSQHSAFARDDENLQGSPTNFAFFHEMEASKRPCAEKVEAMTSTGCYRQSSIRDYCNVTSRLHQSIPAKRIPFGDITNIANTNLYNESPKSRLQSLKPAAGGKRLKRAGAHGARRTLELMHGKPQARGSGGARRCKHSANFYTAETSLAELSILSTSSSMSISFSSESSSFTSKSNVSTSPTISSSSTHKRYSTAIAENAYTHLDDSTIPEAARASLHRVRSSSVLETSHLSSSSDDHSPEKLMAQYSLATVDKPDAGMHSAFAYLSAETLHELLASMCNGEFRRKFVLVDCRFPYEFEGGHITSAHNLYDVKRVESFFYPSDRSAFLDVNAKIPIFYCEYSQKRGPSMALALRQLDRVRNEGRYPKIDYKEIYVLYRGYRNFYHQGYQDLCSPSDYVPMTADSYLNELTEYKSYIRNNAKNYSLYGTEARFHQQAAQRCDELMRSQLNDSFSYMAGESPDVSKTESQRFSRIEDQRLKWNRCTKSNNPVVKKEDDEAKETSAPFNWPPNCTINLSQSQAETKPKSKRRCHLQGLRHVQVKVFKQRFKRSLSDSSALSSSPVLPIVSLPSLDDEFILQEDDRQTEEHTSVEYNMELERMTFSRMSVRSPTTAESDANKALSVLEELPTPPDSGSPS